MIRRYLLVMLVCTMCAAAAALWQVNRRADVTLPSFLDVRASFRPSDGSLLDRQGRILHERRLDLQVQ